MKKPRLLSYFAARAASDRTTDEEELVFHCERREVRLKGRGLARFHDVVIPLLDGQRTRGFGETVRDYLQQELIQHPDAEREAILARADGLLKEME